MINIRVKDLDDGAFSVDVVMIGSLSRLAEQMNSVMNALNEKTLN